jgi:hypothetical protein
MAVPVVYVSAIEIVHAEPEHVRITDGAPPRGYRSLKDGKRHRAHPAEVLRDPRRPLTQPMDVVGCGLVAW